MKKNLFFFGAAALTLAMASCSNEEVAHNPSGAIEFRANSSFNPTRGAAMDLASLGHFHTYAYYENGDPYFSNVLFNQDEANKNTYNSTHSYYWPASGENLKFFAMAPTTTDCSAGNIASQDNLTFDLVDGNVVGKLTGFKPVNAISAQKDIMFATASGNKFTSPSTGVGLNFLHVLSQIEVRAFSNNNIYDFVVRGGVKLNGFGTNATYTLPTGTSSSTASGDAAVLRGVWSAPTEKARYINEGYLAKATLPNNTGDIQYLNLMGESGASHSPAFVIPQKLTGWDYVNNKTNGVNHNDGAYIGVCLQIKKKIGGQIIFPKKGSGVDGAVTENDFMWVAVPVDMTLEAGKRYIFTLDFSEGAGNIDPEEGVDGGAGDSALGAPIKFNVTVEGWTPFNPQPGLNMKKNRK